MSGEEYIDGIEFEECAVDEVLLDETLIHEEEQASGISILRELKRPSARLRIESYFELQCLREQINDPCYHL